MRPLRRTRRKGEVGDRIEAAGITQISAAQSTKRGLETLTTTFHLRTMLPGQPQPRTLSVVNGLREPDEPAIVHGMKVVHYANRSLLMADNDADTLMEYARLIGEHHRTEVVRIRALTTTGQVVEAALLLNSATSLLTESAPEAESSPVPDNTVTRMHLLDRILSLTEEFDISSED